jgi:hypothetical protein
MKDLISALVVGLVMLGGLGALVDRYSPRERSLLFVSLSAHVVSGAALAPVMKGLLGGGDMILYDEIGRNLLDRLFRAPADTAAVLWGLLAHSNDPLPVPDYGLAQGSSGAMLAFTTITLLLTGGSLHAACTLVAGLSFFGKLRLYDVFRAELDEGLRTRVLWATLLVPSVIFWSSGLIKEAFTTIGLGLAFKELHRFFRRDLSLGALLTTASGVLLIATMKGYVLIPLGVASAAAVLLTKRATGRRLTGTRRLVAFAFGIALVFGAGLVSSQYDPTNVVEEASHQQEVGELTSYAGSHYSLVKQHSLAGQIVAVPLALITALFRPFIFEARNAQTAANGLETLFFTILAYKALRRGAAGYRTAREQPILVFCAVMSVIMAVGVGLASTNLGTLSRYRMPMMPFLWVLATAVAASARTGSPSRATEIASPPWLRTSRGS